MFFPAGQVCGWPGRQSVGSRRDPEEVFGENRPGCKIEVIVRKDCGSTTGRCRRWMKKSTDVKMCTIQVEGKSREGCEEIYRYFMVSGKEIGQIDAENSARCANIYVGSFLLCLCPRTFL